MNNAPLPELSDQQLLRYSRQILLPEITDAGQLTLLNSHCAIIGLGGLGSPVALYLAAAGIGKLTLIDFDAVEESNLQRQIIHNEDRLEQNKAESAALTLAKLNPACQTQVISRKLNQEELDKLATQVDLIVECTDNFEIRHQLNSSAKQAKIPLVSAAAIRWEAQITTYDFRDPTTPCYQCLYPAGVNTDESCSANGVIAPLVGMVGSIQALEAIKTLLNLPNLQGKLMLIDGLTMQIRQLNLHQNPNCDCAH